MSPVPPSSRAARPGNRRSPAGTRRSGAAVRERRPSRAGRAPWTGRVLRVLGLLLALLVPAGYAEAPSAGGTAVCAECGAGTGAEYDLLADAALRPAVRVAPRSAPAPRAAGTPGTAPPPARSFLPRARPAVAVARSVVLRC